jgi:hypothetical protein
VQRALVRNYNNLWVKFGDLVGQQVCVPARDQGVNPEALRPQAHYIQSAGADGAG